jgi:hypothetical protein
MDTWVMNNAERLENVRRVMENYVGNDVQILKMQILYELNRPSEAERAVEMAMGAENELRVAASL